MVVINPGEAHTGQAVTDSGFTDQSHLTRRFKRIVGVTPGRYHPQQIGILSKSKDEASREANRIESLGTN